MKRKFQVFISSTYKDLKVERQAAVEAVLTSGNIPAGMELFAAGNESQLETVKRWIDECDVYLLILGGRYGSIEPKSKQSYIEVEYRYALQCGKFVFALVANEAALEIKRKVGLVEKDKKVEYEKFKRFVQTKIIQFYEDVKDIKIEIMKTLGVLKDNEKIPGWISSLKLKDYEGDNAQLVELAREKNELMIKLREYEKGPKGMVNRTEVKKMVNYLFKHKITIEADRIRGMYDVQGSAGSILYTNYAKFIIGVGGGSYGDNEIDFFDIAVELSIFRLFERDDSWQDSLRFKLTEFGQEVIIYLRTDATVKQKADVSRFEKDLRESKEKYVDEGNDIPF